MDKINKVAVFGMGKSGISAVKLACEKGLKVFAVNQGTPGSWFHQDGLDSILKISDCYSQEEFKSFHEMDEIILSPGIPVTHPALKEAVEKGVPIISEIEFAWREVKKIPVIGITGTNGKTTTTTMIADLLKKAGKRVFYGGNIGIPYCEMALSNDVFDYAVIELSSFQLETIREFHPHIGLILNIFPNHSERYGEVYDYARAKFRMLMNMNKEDFLILGTENPFLNDIEKHPSQKLMFTKGKLPESFKKSFDFSEARARGEHNESNFYAAYKVIEILKIEKHEKLMQDFINEFPGVAHRLEFTLEKNGLTVYNDAKSTNSLATTTAIKAFKDAREPLHLILGGKLRSEGDHLLPELLPYKELITTIFCIGDVTDRLLEELGQDFKVIPAKDLKRVFSLVKEMELKGNLVFSPSFPSFDQFNNYVDRGEKFKQWAKEILG
jgi:UDP-N-acetylmuramoylalanine--D-glutamate ligase